MDNLIIPAAIGLGIYAWQSDPRNAGRAEPVPQRQPLKGANRSSPIATAMVLSPTAFASGKGQTTNSSPTVTRGGLISAWPASKANADAVRQRIRELEDRAKAEYNRLGKEAKVRAAAELNKMSPSPGLTGDESFDEAAAKVGASIGSVVALAGCNAIPIPGVATVLAHTACATLGAMIGAFLGEKLGKWAVNIYDDVKEFAAQKWDALKDTAGDVADAVGGAAEDVYNFAGDLF
jgi:hypothetical protein